eukprot:CAMPEP_0117631704 /NCGR_PEP_ID=MMETSP0802-20121206/4178_1 /TAXON_ID=38833 /ORGANISM="Micromonas sp., Strain CCMP2099" /LENGTH=158 /DNA_ID=CAMNT_0005436073 /DNA_START=44 /DNA_END=521 /DNA_ORIENTATION=-
MSAAACRPVVARVNAVRRSTRAVASVGKNLSARVYVPSASPCHLIQSHPPYRLAFSLFYDCLRCVNLCQNPKPLFQLSFYSPFSPVSQVRERQVRPSRGEGPEAATVVTASALPLIAEIAAVGPEIAEVAVTCTLITLVGLAIGFVLLRVEAAVEGQE